MTPENTNLTSWSPEQNKVIEMYQTKFAMTRSNAIRKLRTQEQRGITAAQILAAPVEPKLKQVQEKPAAKAPKAKREAKKSSEPKEPAFNTKPAGKGVAYSTPGKNTGKYDKQLVVNLYMDGGKTPSEIAKLGSAGIKNISPVYCHRLIFGNEESGGIDEGQAARRKEQSARVKAWAAEKAKESK